MKYEYIINTTDLSFDYGDRTYYDTQYNGFYLELDKNDVINFSSFEPFGNCVEAMENVKSLEDLKRFLTGNIEYIEDEYKEIINELIYFINENIKEAKAWMK